MRGAEFYIIAIIGIILITLKIAGLIGWSWWFVTVPFWVPVLLISIFTFLYLLGFFYNRLKDKF